MYFLYAINNGLSNHFTKCVKIRVQRVWHWHLCVGVEELQGKTSRLIILIVPMIIVRQLDDHNAKQLMLLIVVIVSLSIFPNRCDRYESL